MFQLSTTFYLSIPESFFSEIKINVDLDCCLILVEQKPFGY